MCRLLRWLLIFVGVSLAVAVVLSAVIGGLEQASWLAGVGSLLLAFGTAGAARGGAAPPPKRTPPRKHEIISSSTSSVEATLFRLRSEYNWTVDRRTEATVRVVYWPIHLRPPTLIHAVQALAAATLSAGGAEVIVCIEDLHEEAPRSLTADLMGAIEGWFSAIPGANAPIRYESVRNFLDTTRSSEADVDPWRLAESYYRRTTVVEVLTESKIIKPPIGDEVASSLGRANAYRLLTAPVVWSLMHYLLRDVDLAEVITLGGLDEERMWRRWHGIQHGNLNHLYNPLLVGLEHDSRQMRWSNVAELRKSFADSLKKSPGGSGFLHWVTMNALLLPASLDGRRSVELVGKTCSTWVEIEELLREDTDHAVTDIAKQVSKFYLSHRR